MHRGSPDAAGMAPEVGWEKGRNTLVFPRRSYGSNQQEITMLPLRTTAVVFAGLALVTAACGDDSDDADEGDSEDSIDVEADAEDVTEPDDDDAMADEGEEADAADSESDGDGGSDTIVVGAVDFAFEDLPETVPAGTTISLVNESPDELHELVAIRIPDGDDRSVEDLLAVPPEEGEEEAPPDLVIVAMPGEEGMPVLGDGTLTEPGRYAIFCAIPTGADPAEYMAAAEEATEGPPEVEGGPPHFVHGMLAELTVE